jgi:hypothetical protein
VNASKSQRAATWLSLVWPGLGLLYCGYRVHGTILAAFPIEALFVCFAAGRYLDTGPIWIGVWGALYVLSVLQSVSDTRRIVRRTD